MAVEHPTSNTDTRSEAAEKPRAPEKPPPPPPDRPGTPGQPSRAESRAAARAPETPTEQRAPRDAKPSSSADASTKPGAQDRPTTAAGSAASDWGPRRASKEAAKQPQDAASPEPRADRGPSIKDGEATAPGKQPQDGPAADWGPRRASKEAAKQPQDAATPKPRDESGNSGQGARGRDAQRVRETNIEGTTPPAKPQPGEATDRRPTAQEDNSATKPERTPPTEDNQRPSDDQHRPDAGDLASFNRPSEITKEPAPTSDAPSGKEPVDRTPRPDQQPTPEPVAAAKAQDTTSEAPTADAPSKVRGDTDQAASGPAELGSDAQVQSRDDTRPGKTGTNDVAPAEHPAQRADAEPLSNADDASDPSRSERPSNDEMDPGRDQADPTGDAPLRDDPERELARIDGSSGTGPADRMPMERRDYVVNLDADLEGEHEITTDTPLVSADNSSTDSSPSGKADNVDPDTGDQLVRDAEGEFGNAGTSERVDALNRQLALGKELAELVEQKVDAEIDEALDKVNPKFDWTKSAYSENCTSVVQANEMRRRGLDVEAGPLEKHLRTDEGGPGGRPLSAMEQVWGNQFIPGTKAEIEEAFKEPGSRGIVYVAWNSPGGGAHVFNVENVGGKVRFVDGQPTPSVHDASHYFSRGRNTKYLRVDGSPTPPDSVIKKFLEP